MAASHLEAAQDQYNIESVGGGGGCVEWYDVTAEELEALERLGEGDDLDEIPFLEVERQTPVIRIDIAIQKERMFDVSRIDVQDCRRITPALS